MELKELKKYCNSKSIIWKWLNDKPKDNNPEKIVKSPVLLRDSRGKAI